MDRKAKEQLIIGASLLVVFILYTVSLTMVDVAPIGPDGSCVGYASINKTVHELFGVHMVLYDITDIAGYVVIAVAAQFAVIGLFQWIGRKSIFKVDRQLLLLGAFYIIVFGTYALFELIEINYRPVLIEGALEASYPSSTTMLAMCVLPTAMMQYRRMIRSHRLCNVINTIISLLTVFMVVGRLICGVHWFTDILGGSIFSAAVVLLYVSVSDLSDRKNEA